MARGYSLEQDLALLVNNQKYSDVEIICEDEKILYGSRAILAARSELFDGLLYSGMKESYEKQISFPTINSSIMKIILEYIYTGSIKEESLTEENIIETFYAADYLHLLSLQDYIIKFLKNILEKDNKNNCLPELLSKVVKTIQSTEVNNVLLNFLVESVAIIPLNTIEFGRLSIAGLQHLLSYTHEKEKPFKTTEYEVFRYSAILVAKQVSNDAYKSLMERLPISEQIEKSDKDKFINDHQKIAKELEPLINFIDFRKINGQILVNMIEPLKIVQDEIIANVYRDKIQFDRSNLKSPKESYLTCYL
ncbi:BTB/POZ protein [Glomus cerebriforme]|uniref:BTB/POZ protein n=1 Tax=Glomus cerebriforme TaxID=658196 RepID=A0A397SHP0_9GLOM|nr:BTB/POZ protein [Glomus cerebriforme]